MIYRGLKYVSSHRVERIHAIADFLASSSTTHSRNTSVNSLEAFSDLQPNSQSVSPILNHKTEPHSRSHSNSTKILIDDKTGTYDVVALQELWVYHDFLVIRDRAKEGGLVYSKWFHSAALGAGLAILSRYPIVESHFYAYALNGHPLHFIEGDFFVGKAVGSCLLDVPLVGEVEVFSTHLYAPHDVPAPEWKRAHRTAQAWELGKLVKASAERGRTVFVCGDLNSVPSSLPITILQAHGQLRDSWQSSHPTNLSCITNNEASYRNAIKEEGITCDSLINTFTASKNAANRGAKGFGKRLDYILFRPAAKRTTQRDKHGRCSTEFIDDQTIICDDCHVTLTDPIPVFGYSYSDHFALQATFTIYPNLIESNQTTDSSSSTQTKIASNHLSTPPTLTSEHLNNSMSALMTKYRSSQRSTTFQLGLFGLCLILTPGIAVAASFQPLSFLNWIFTLLSIFVGGFGMTMLYTGFLGGSWERSSIKEVCEEMEFELEKLRKIDQTVLYNDRNGNGTVVNGNGILNANMNGVNNK
ncbi:Endonuclease/exonuclease/phosphatase [Melampsora americana]|nr:Endonuclease/exonuclease/phosphatase [Melampsora americana]